jgi:SnoaL-like protein
MSQEPAATDRGVPQRDVLDRLLFRVPALTSLMAGRLRRTPPGSSLRRRLLNFQVKRAFAAIARSDAEVALLVYEPDVEMWIRGLSGVDISDCYRGHEGVRTMMGEMDEAFADWWWTPRAIADGGERIAIRGDFVAYGETSGIKVTRPDSGTALKLSSRGFIVWQEWFTEQGGWKKALEAAGLSE